MHSINALHIVLHHTHDISMKQAEAPPDFPQISKTVNKSDLSFKEYKLTPKDIPGAVIVNERA